MKLISSLIVFIGTADVAGAHGLESDASLADQLSHQVLGLHHLPVTVILIVAGLIMLRVVHWKAGAQKNK
jgi:hypothetical protein